MAITSNPRPPVEKDPSLRAPTELSPARPRVRMDAGRPKLSAMTTVNIEALAGIHLDALTPGAQPWHVRRQLDRYVAALRGASPEDVAKASARALSTFDPELVAQAFAVDWPALQLSTPDLPELSTRSPTATASHPLESADELSPPELSPLCRRILARLSPGTATSRRDVHRGVQRHVAGATELDDAIAELGERGLVRLVGEGSRAAIELLPIAVNASR